jgi:uncharacterized protein (DUF488 family)
MGRVFTVGHGARSADELVEMLAAARVRTLVDVRRFPGSRRHPQFGRAALSSTLEGAGIAYVHEVELGGRRSREPGEERFPCVGAAAFRSYVARMGQQQWQDSFSRSLEAPAPCFMCAETLSQRCHRRFIAELLAARGHEVLHLVRPGETQRHRPHEQAEYRDGRLFVCGRLVA